MPDIGTHRLHTARHRSWSSLPAWMWLVGLFAVLIIWQGAFRKWFLPGLATPLYVAKDVVLVTALVMYGMRHRIRLSAPLQSTALPPLLGTFAYIVLLQAFNFNYPSLLGSIIGARSYLLYSSLLIFMPHIMDRVKNPERVVTWTVVVGIIPVLILGYYQYSQPTDAWINQYVAKEANVVGVSGRPRITGTFSYIGGMSAFLIFSLFASIAVFLSGLKFRNTKFTCIGGVLLLIALIVAPMNGSRSVVLGVLLPLPFVLYAILKGRRGVSALLVSLSLLAGGGYLLQQSDWASQGWETVGQRLEHGQESGEQEARIENLIRDPISKMEVSGMLGYGTGGTNNASAALTGQSVNPGVGYEGELGRVIIELGVLGGLLFFALKAWLAWTAWQALIRARTAWTTLLAITAFSNLFLTLISGMIVFNHIAGSLYWLCAGIAVWLWSRQEIHIQSIRRPSRITHPHG